LPFGSEPHEVIRSHDPLGISRIDSFMHWLISFAGIDWIETLEPEFHSSIYGLLYLCFTLLDGVAFGIGKGLFSGRRIGRTRGYSALLLLTILLAYLHAMQYIVIWPVTY
jgi:hypothetical protein